ncbi:response regulator [Sansalvadorimonas verongulae]|uniref:response regulator n=1 Tax=Sansalvadorimonas verongulae TaxID=2172824 RepID=UPI0012BC7BA2|nr:response regulator [Sansalvadorimonas verongulae]MTI14261.1 response regulator [Sansalvadorimonas verongulae]
MNNAQGSCVFLLENDQAVTSAIMSLCEKGQLTLRCFSSWEDMENSLDSHKPSYLIMSNALCSSSICEKVSHITNVGIPVIVLGKQHDLNGAVASIQAGAIDYIEKPVIHGRLAEYIASISA